MTANEDTPQAGPLQRPVRPYFLRGQPMLAWWTELLPLFVVRWLAMRYCEHVTAYPHVCKTARPDVLLVVMTTKLEKQ